MSRRSWLAVPALAVLASCASAPPPVSAEGEEELAITAYETVAETQPLSGSLTGFRMDPIEGASCVLHNDRGSWTVTTPGNVRVERSLEPLEFECAREGYGVVRGKLRCLTEEQRNAPGDSFAIFQLFTFGPLAIAAAPIAPAIALQAGSQALVAGAGLAASESSKSRKRGVCSYLGLRAQMAAVSPRRP